MSQDTRVLHAGQQLHHVLHSVYSKTEAAEFLSSSRQRAREMLNVLGSSCQVSCHRHLMSCSATET